MIRVKSGQVKNGGVNCNKILMNKKVFHKIHAFLVQCIMKLSSTSPTPSLFHKSLIYGH